MPITLKTVHKDIQQVKTDLDRMRDMLGDEGELTDEARRDIAIAREEMAKGEYISHEEIMAKYG